MSKKPGSKWKTRARLLTQSLSIFALRPLSKLVPKRRDLLLFGSWLGQNFADNAKYLYLRALRDHGKEYEILWVTRSQAVQQLLERHGLPVLRANSLRGIWKSLRAGAIFTTHDSRDVGGPLSDSSLQIKSYHATLPIKKMGFDTPQKIPRGPVQRLRRWFADPYYFAKPDYSISSSELVSGIVASSLAIRPDQVLLTGYPRADYLLEPSTTALDDEYVASLLGRFKDSKILYFVPTFRDSRDFDFFAFGFDIERLARMLEERDAVIVFRFHPFDLARIDRDAGFSHPRIVLERASIGDPYPVLKRSTLLITDYSSIFADYLLLDRPTIFANFDHEGYLRERELYWDYDAFTPGLKAADWPALVAAIERVLAAGGQDGFAAQRAELRRKVFLHEDGCSSERILEAARSTLS